MSSIGPLLALAAGLWLVGLVPASDGSSQRSRAEAVPGMQASNTVGQGDIWLGLGGYSFIRVQPMHRDRLAAMVDSAYRDDLLRLRTGSAVKRDLFLVPQLAGAIGLTGFIQAEGKTVPWDGRKLGASTASVKITTPFNDDLRTFGVAVSLSATLSTEENIYVGNERTPGFDPILHLTAIGDLDLVKLLPALPLKAYFNYANLDDHRLQPATGHNASDYGKIVGEGVVGPGQMGRWRVWEQRFRHAPTAV